MLRLKCLLTSCVLALSVSFGLTVAGPAYAVTLVGTTTNASGIDGVVIDSVTYDVTFVRDSYNNVYASTPPTFLNSAGVTDATTALISALNVLKVTQLVGMSPYPDWYAAYYAAIPQSLSGTTVNAYAAACDTTFNSGCTAGTWGVGTAFPNVSDTLPFNSNSNLGLQLDYTVFTAAGATPLPSTWLMLLSGFVGLGFFAYRGTKKRAAIAAA
jgi:hypothetical protein